MSLKVKVSYGTLSVTFHQFHDLDAELDLHRLWVVSMEHLQRMWHASRERIPFRTPGSVPHCGTCLCSNCWDQIPRTWYVFTRLYTSNTPWYFLDFTLLTRNRLVFRRWPEWFARAFTICNWMVRPSFVRLFIRLSVISSRLHLKVWWLHSSQIWTAIHHRVARPSSVDITCPFGLGRGQNVGLWAFARFWLCFHQGHPCSINKFYCPITLKGFKKYIVDSGSGVKVQGHFCFCFYMWNLIGTTHITFFKTSYIC